MNNNLKSDFDLIFLVYIIILILSNIYKQIILYILIMSILDDQYLTKLYNDLQNEKQKLFIELNNDKELTHEREITQKMSAVDSILKGVIKYRNLKIKAQQKFTL